MARFFLVLAIFLSVAVAQTVKEVRFEGLVHLSPQKAKEIVQIESGEEKLDIKKVDKAIKRLFSQGYFDDIWVTEERGVLTFHFKEKPVISQIEFSGYGENKKDELLSQISLKKGDIYDDRKIKEAVAKLKLIIESEGYFDTIIEPKVTTLQSGSIKIKFVINKGENIIIEKLNLCGAKSFEKREIESTLVNRERDFMGWLWGLNDGKANIEQLQYDPARIKEFYMRHGYLDAVVENPLLRVDFRRYAAILDYKITEGMVYRVKDVKIEIREPVINIDSLKEDLKVEPGDIFNIDDLRVDIQRIKEKIANLGYAYVKVFPDFKKDKNKHTVVVVYSIDPGDKVYIKDVIISGNSRTLDRVVRREVFLAPGDLYNLTDLKDSKSALMRTGYFENVVIDERRVSKNEMELVVNVKETQTGNIMIGGGYGSYDGFIVNASINDRNIFGSGLSLGLSVDFSRRRNFFNFNITNPRVFDSDYSTGFNIYNSQYIAYNYTEKRKGGSVNIGRKIARYWNIGLSYQYFSTQLTGMDPNYPDYDLYNEKPFNTSAITPSIRFNNTDDYYLPRKGMIFGISSEFAGLGADARFNKNFINFSAFKGLEDEINYDLILRYKARVGFIPWSQKLPVNEKFFMGGIRSVRGYQSRSISAKDANGYLLGGKYTFSNSIEASIPLLKEARMRLALFLDYGMIGEEVFADEKRAGTGVAIEWFSPMGPISLIFARPLMSKDGDRTSSFEFTMGTQF